ncbi:MAG TPA: hypothetical protein VF719_03335 [Abditibacteriaceae bacterium]
MRKLLLGLTTLFILAAAIFANPASAAPRRMVVVVAEGLGPQVIDFGTAYSKTAYEQGAAVAFDDIKTLAKTQNIEGDAIGSLRGILKTASTNGYKTGLVTTADITTVAPIFYDLPAGDAAATAQTLLNNTRFDVLAGGGRAHFGDAKTFADAGNSTLFTVESLDEEVKGKVLALQSDTALTYGLDRDIEKDAGFAELVTLALQTLNTDEAPFVLVVHDNLLARALAAKDTPAYLSQFREIDGIVADVLGAREENTADFGVAIIGTGGSFAPRFTTELPNERSEAFYIVSQLPLSYGGAGASLNGANDAALTTFATDRYKGWKLSAENRAAILAGQMTPEVAIRTSYEPVLKIAYEPATTGSVAHVIGFDAANGVAGALNAIVSRKPAANAPAVPEL